MDEAELPPRTWIQLQERMSQGDADTAWALFERFVNHWYGGKVPGTEMAVEAVPPVVHRANFGFFVSAVEGGKDWAPGCRAELDALVGVLERVLQYMEALDTGRNLINRRLMDQYRDLIQQAKISGFLGSNLIFNMTIFSFRMLMLNFRRTPAQMEEWENLVADYQEAARRLNQAVGVEVIPLPGSEL